MFPRTAYKYIASAKERNVPLVSSPTLFMFRVVVQPVAFYGFCQKKIGVFRAGIVFSVLYDDLAALTIMQVGTMDPEVFNLYDI